MAQVRLNARRFIAVSLAVIIAVSFLTATLIINSSSKASLTQSIGEGFRNADLVLTGQYDPDQGLTVMDDDDAALVRGTDGVSQMYAVREAYVLFDNGGSSNSGQLFNTPEAPSQMPVDVEEGNLPAADDEVAVDRATADRLDLSVGSTLGMSALQDSAAGQERKLVVSAIVAESRDPQMMGAAVLYAADAVVAPYADPEQGFSSIQVEVSSGSAVRDVQADLERALTDAGSTGVAVRTVEEQTNETVASFTGGNDQLTIVLLAFAAVALLVCALVVSNTFSVLVAQRTRELALLRCIGADRAQIRRSVMVEALVVGVASSLLGVGVAIGLMAAIVAFLRTIPESGFATLAVSPLAVTVGLVVGILLTVLSALVPARAATAVSPLAALRPAEDVRAGTRKGRIRLVFGLVLTVGGGLLLGAGALSSNLLIALPGGILSFVGILMCGTLFIPPLVRAVGSLAAPLGVPGKLAAVNAIRNPQRTAATSSALLIGVTLVTMMMTGAATSRTAFDGALGQQFPVDVNVRGSLPNGSPLSEADAAAARTVDGVEEAVLLPVAGLVDYDGWEDGVYVLDPADSAVLRDPGAVPQPGSIIMPEGTDAKSLTVRGAETDLVLTVIETENAQMAPLISAETARALGGVPDLKDPEAWSPVPELWIAAGDLSAAELTEMQSELVNTLGIEDYQVSGAAVVRAAFEQVIDVLLMVVTGLLGVAVLIALVGVANTLSLSVLERTRESSLLRALGLTRRQLRGMLALEAVLIAGVAALFGCALGTLYGWLGAQSALGTFAAVAPTVPWVQLAAVLAVALVAGLLASVLPARRAARLSPVAGLAAD